MLPKVFSIAVVAAVVTSFGAFANPAVADPVQPSVSVGDTHIVEPTVRDATTAVDFVVTLDRAATGPVFVAYRTRRGSAFGSGRDYYAVSGLVGISPGQTTAHVGVRVRGDRRNEGVESFDLELTRATGATLADSLGTATIEPPFALTLGRASVLEPTAGNFGAAEVVASLGAPMKVPVTFGWRTATTPAADDPATPGNDYLPRAAFATIPAGQTSVSLDVLTKGDGTAEGNETIAVKVDAGSTSVPVLQDGEITIIDAGTQTAPPPQPPPTTTPPTTTTPTTATTTTTTAPPPTTVPPTNPPTTVPPTTTPPPTVPPSTAPPTTVPPTAPPTTAPPVSGPSSSNLADFINMPGDEVVKVPNGYYHGGEIDTAHPATTGPYKGWLVLVAQSQGNVIVDLSNAPLTLGPDTSRVMFVGFTFVNGSVFVAGHDITFWYTQHTFPADVWAHQAPDLQHPSSGLYRAPRTVYVRDGAQRVRFYGSDLHDTATAFSVTNTTDVLLDGVTTWNLSDLGLDPEDVVHPDAIAAVSGNNTGFTVADSWIRGRIMIQDQANDGSGGPQVGLLFKHLWVSGSPSSGFTFTAARPPGSGGVFGARDDIRSWGHKNGYDRIDIVDGVQYHNANAQPSRIDVTDTAISTAAPSYGMVSPADQWRAAHPLDSWPEMIDGQL